LYHPSGGVADHEHHNDYDHDERDVLFVRLRTAAQAHTLPLPLHRSVGQYEAGVEESEEEKRENETHDVVEHVEVDELVEDCLTERCSTERVAGDGGVVTTAGLGLYSGDRLEEARQVVENGEESYGKHSWARRQCSNTLGV